MIEGISSMYRPQFVKSILYLLRMSDYRLVSYERNFWGSSSFSDKSIKLSTSERLLQFVLFAGILLQISGCLAVAAWGYQNHRAGIFQIAIALSIAAPLIWAQLLAFYLGLFAVISAIASPKKTGKALITKRLEKQVIKLRSKNDILVVAVVGSVGKTSTKLAVVKTLQLSGMRVRFQEGNYNDRLTVPMVFFGKDLPGLTNVIAWRRILNENRRDLQTDYPFDVVVVELGIDGPRQIKPFAYLKPDLSIVTAVSAEHTEYLGSIDKIAKEELSVSEFSKQLLINSDDVDRKYLKKLNYLSYGTKKPADYLATNIKRDGLLSQAAKLHLGNSGTIDIETSLLGGQGLKVITAAAAAASILGIEPKTLPNALAQISAFSGRMRVLKGIKSSLIIDDTYNSSPIANMAAIDVLSEAPASQRIAILGSMNELGDYSEQAHREVGQYCSPKKLDLVITIGEQAERWLAPEALDKGCQVASFASPYEAGEYARQELKKNAVVLAKGSQNGVFAEESLKALLAKQSDSKHLVRQSAYWVKVKARQFPAPKP